MNDVIDTILQAEARAEEIVGRMAEEDLTVCLVTDAGTPCISDPGYRVVEAAWAAGISSSV